MAITSKIGTSDSLLGNIGFGGGVTSPIKIANISETLTLIINQTPAPSYKRDVSQFLGLSDIALRVLPHTNFLLTSLHITFFETVSNVTHHTRNISETLTLVEEAKVRLPETFSPVISESLTLAELRPRNFRKQMSVSHTLVFSETKIPGTRHNRNIDENLFLVERANEVLAKLGPVSESLTIVETVTAKRIRIRNISEHLVINQAITQGANVFTRNVTEILPLVEGYRYPVRVGGQVIWVPGSQGLKVPKKCFVLLECPQTGTAIMLPCPQNGDSEKNLHSQVVTRTMTNKLYTYVRRNNLQQLNYQFVLGRPLTLNFKSFCQINIDQVITLTNWKGEIWKVYISNNPLEYTGKSLFDNEGERWDIPFEFQGVKIQG